MGAEGKKDLLKEIRSWLEGQGYPLEMQVAKIWHDAEFDVAQAIYYRDTESDDMREIDLVVTKSISVERSLDVRLLFVVECKSSKKKKPWVLFTGTDPLYEIIESPSFRAANARGRKLLTALSTHDEEKPKIFSLPECLSYGIASAFSDGPDPTYSALISVSKAATSQIMEYDQNIVMVLGRPQAVIVMPVIITAGPLIEARLAANGSVELKQISMGAVYWGNPVLSGGYPIIDVVSIDGLKEYVRTAKESWVRLAALSTGQLKEDLLRA